MRSFSIFSLLASLTLYLSLSAANEIPVEYKLQARFRDDKTDLYLHLTPSSTIQGVVLYEHSEERNPYQNIPLTSFSAEAGQKEEVFLISFRSNLLDTHPMTIKLLVADPRDDELSKTKQLYSLIESAEPNSAHLNMLKSEFARRTEPWAFREQVISVQGNRSNEKRVTIGGTIIRNERSPILQDLPDNTDYTISGSMSLDKHGRGHAIIKLPQGAND